MGALSSHSTTTPTTTPVESARLAANADDRDRPPGGRELRTLERPGRAVRRRQNSGQNPAPPRARAHDTGRLLMPTTLTGRGSDPAASTTPRPRVDATLPPRTVACLAGSGRPRS